MPEIICPQRQMHGDQPVCQIVADLIDRPLSESHTNDSTCTACLKCEIAPQVPNPYTASMVIHVALRTKDTVFIQATLRRFSTYLKKVPPAPTTCVLRGPETRKVACKPCQADSLTPVMVPVFRCPQHQECTLHNTGTFPKLQACATCPDRLEKYVQLDPKPHPPAVLAAIAKRAGIGNHHAR